MSGVLIDQYKLEPGTGLVTVTWDKSRGYVVSHMVSVLDPKYGNIYSAQTERTYATEKKARAAGKRMYNKIMEEYRAILGMPGTADDVARALIDEAQGGSTNYTNAEIREAIDTFGADATIAEVRRLMKTMKNPGGLNVYRIEIDRGRGRKHVQHNFAKDRETMVSWVRRVLLPDMETSLGSGKIISVRKASPSMAAKMLKSGQSKRNPMLETTGGHRHRPWRPILGPPKRGPQMWETTAEYDPDHDDELDVAEIVAKGRNVDVLSSEPAGPGLLHIIAQTKTKRNPRRPIKGQQIRSIWPIVKKIQWTHQGKPWYVRQEGWVVVEGPDAQTGDYYVFTVTQHRDSKMYGPRVSHATKRLAVHAAELRAKALRKGHGLKKNPYDHDVIHTPSVMLMVGDNKGAIKHTGKKWVADFKSAKDRNAFIRNMKTEYPNTKLTYRRNRVDLPTSTKRNPAIGDVAYELENIHITSVRPGDVIMHDGELRTISKKDIKQGGMGRTIWGDSYKLGTKPVLLARIKHAKPTKKNPKTKAPTGKTKEVVDQIMKIFKRDPQATFHPSLFTLSGYRANTVPAIRWLKKMGMLRVAYRNIDGEPVYGLAGETLPKSAAYKPNPRISEAQAKKMQTKYPYSVRRKVGGRAVGPEISLIMAPNHAAAVQAWRREQRVLYPTMLGPVKIERTTLG